MVDTEETAYAVVNVHADRLEIKGFGRQKNMTLPIAGNGGGNEPVNSRIIIKTADPDIALATDGKLGAAELQKSNDLRSWRKLSDVPKETSEVLVTPRERGNEFYRLKKK